MSRRPPWRSLLVNLGVLAVTLLLFLAVVELGLRISGFSYVLYPEEIEFGAPDPVTLQSGFVEDGELFWVTPDYEEKLARLAGQDLDLVFMGDSCTQFGVYDEALARLVRERRGVDLVYGNLGVAGWTSYQGRRQLERDVVRLRPAVVTIYYGWNDHWIGFGLEDKNVARIKRVFSSRWSGLRLVQLMTQATVALESRDTAFPERVSLADFSANLRAMVETARAAGIEPVLLTAPTSIRRGAEPEYLTARWLRELDDLVPLHGAYAAVVREVASAEGAALCDLERRFAAWPRKELEAAFMADGIHLTEEGSRRLGEMLYGCLEEGGNRLPRARP